MLDSPPASVTVMNLNWWLSRTVRHATHMRKHVWHILCAQRDLLSPSAIEKVTAALQNLQKACAGRLDKNALRDRMSNLETVANKWLMPYPSAAFRENVEVLLVAIVVAMGIRTFFIQPFKIPTGSMQPTLYGITHENLTGQNVETPGFLRRLSSYWIDGVSYKHVTAKVDGTVTHLDEAPTRFLLFNLWQRFQLGGVTHTVWFPPENLWRRVLIRDDNGGLVPLVDPYGRTSLQEKNFKAGEDVINLKVNSGDHLFVDRLTYNFRAPKRGEIIVFETKNIPAMQPDQQGQFYIKRLVALGGEKVRIGDDRHVYINGQRLDASTPHFEKVYSFDPAKPPADSQYSGHVNDHGRGVAPLFLNEETVREVPPGQYMVMGDNTVNSSDSRTWGSFPKENVIGRSFFVYWPFGKQDSRPSRFGWGNR
jgi:signal peptidase I